MVRVGYCFELVLCSYFITEFLTEGELQKNEGAKNNPASYLWNMSRDNSDQGKCELLLKFSSLLNTVH